MTLYSELINIVWLLNQPMNQQIKLLQKTGIIAIDGSSFQQENHQHHALQIVVSLDKAPDSHHFLVENKPVASSGIIIAPNIPHQIQGNRCLVLLIETESHLAESISNTYFQSASYHSLSSNLRNEIVTIILENEFNWCTFNKVFSLLNIEICLERHIEPRLLELVNWFDEVELIGDWESLNLSAALEKTHLSQSRFLHLFSEQLGITWRQYILWRRLLAAIKYALAGNSLTKSAQHACFSDSAHFSRVFKSMLGISPSQVIKNIKLQQ